MEVENERIGVTRAGCERGRVGRLGEGVVRERREKEEEREAMVGVVGVGVGVVENWR